MILATFQVGWLSIAWTVAGTIGGTLFLLWGIISGFRRRNRIAIDSLDKARADLVAVTREEAKAWQSRYETEHDEHAQYRNKVHDRNNETNAIVIRLTADNAELRAKTDLSPILLHQKEQTAINAKVVKALDAILLHLEKRNGQAA